MAKVTNPLFSIGATGAIGKTMIFAGLGKGHRAYRLKPPKGSGTPSRKQKYAQACANWQTKTEEEKNIYSIAARPLKLTGFNLYMREQLNTQQGATTWDAGSTTWDAGATFWD